MVDKPVTADVSNLADNDVAAVVVVVVGYFVVLLLLLVVVIIRVVVAMNAGSNCRWFRTATRATRCDHCIFDEASTRTNAAIATKNSNTTNDCKE